MCSTTLHSTVATTEDALMSAFIETETPLHSTLATTEESLLLCAATMEPIFTFYFSNN